VSSRWITLVLLLSAHVVWAAEPIPVVATLPVLADLTREIGGRHVHVRSLITGSESEHTYTPRPGDLIAIQKARLLVQIGLGLEVWVQALIQNSDRPDLPIVTTSDGVPLLRDNALEAAGDPHDGMGNVHVWLDPENVKVMVRHIADGLMKVDPAHKADYLNNRARYTARLAEMTDALKKRVAKLTDRRLITHHLAWPYFARRFGFVVRGSIQAGGEASEPSAKHLAVLIRQIRQEKIRVIASEPALSQKIPQALADETGAIVVRLAPLPGAITGVDSYLQMMRYNVETLATALDRPASATHDLP
jgi:ABC-type Zn uptake system ZnuABC Zn-binding protein ZnuA